MHGWGVRRVVNDYVGGEQFAQDLVVSDQGPRHARDRNAKSQLSARGALLRDSGTKCEHHQNTFDSAAPK